MLTGTENSESQAKVQLESIVEMVRALAGEDNEDAQQTIQEDPLSVEVRSDWEAVGSVLAPSEFRIVLCTGGPAVQIVGELDEHQQPSRPRIQHQDWGTPWTELFGLSDEEQKALQTYCEQFYFGDG